MHRIRLVLLVVTLTGLAGAAAPPPLAEWLLDQPHARQQWRPNGDLTAISVTNGALSCRTIGADPIFELIPLLRCKASSRQVVEIRLRADRDGVAELFWSNTSTGRYGGFSQEKSTRFNVSGDNAWHTYRLLPGWQREGTIARLRFDLYDAAQFAWASLRVLELDGDASPRAEFDFPGGAAGWQWFEPVDGREPPGWRSGQVSQPGAGFLLGPPLRVSAAENSFVSVRLSASRGQHGTLYFLTDSRPGLHSRTFKLEPDRREHTYNLDMLEAADWGGTVLGLGLRPSDDPEAVATVRRVRVGEAPEGPPQLKVVSFALAQALPRANLPATLEATIANRGGDTATNILAEIQLPAGLKCSGDSPPRQTIDRLAFDQEASLTWQVASEQPLDASVRLRLEAPQAEPLTASAPVRLFARPKVSTHDYVPEPKPVRGPFEVGAYYFPGWKTASQWHPLRRFPERKPVLGWYREGDPEVADWHIKWAVEHGITFFAYDWYWSQGTRQLEHALHEGYFQARYRRWLKFCLLWANHNAPHTSSQEDCMAVTRYWIEHYFRRPEHLQFEGKPVMIIFAPSRLTEDLGSEGVKQAFAAMRAECRKAGLGGLHLIACVGDAGGARRAAAEGYDSVTAYNWPGLGMTGEGLFAPFETLLPAYRRQWEQLSEMALPLWPVPVCGGWDSRPWHGENNLVRFGRTPALFRQHLLDARKWLERGPPSAAASRAILVEAWNEWGEGSYIEPHAEFGFGYLDAVREVFTPAPATHQDLTPADIGRGPYEVPPSAPPRTTWDFARDDQGWNHGMDLADLGATEGRLRARTTGTDPAFFGPPMQAAAADFQAVLVRLRLSLAAGGRTNDMAQLFWRTSRLAENESSSAGFPVQADGQWHDYVVPVARNPRWRGTITRLRLDPATQTGVLAELNLIRLEPAR